MAKDMVVASTGAAAQVEGPPPWVSVDAAVIAAQLQLPIDDRLSVITAKKGGGGKSKVTSDSARTKLLYGVQTRVFNADPQEDKTEKVETKLLRQFADVRPGLLGVIRLPIADKDASRGVLEEGFKRAGAVWDTGPAQDHEHFIDTLIRTAPWKDPSWKGGVFAGVVDPDIDAPAEHTATVRNLKRVHDAIVRAGREDLLVRPGQRPKTNEKGQVVGAQFGIVFNRCSPASELQWKIPFRDQMRTPAGTALWAEIKAATTGGSAWASYGMIPMAENATIKAARAAGIGLVHAWALGPDELWARIQGAGGNTVSADEVYLDYEFLAMCAERTMKNLVAVGLGGSVTIEMVAALGGKLKAMVQRASDYSGKFGGMLETDFGE